MPKAGTFNGENDEVLFQNSPVTCAIDYLSSSKKYSIYSISREQFVDLRKCINELKTLTWGNLMSGNNKFKITHDNKGTKGYNLIDEKRSQSEIEATHYFHLRVSSKLGTFRLFGFQSSGTFFITHIDPKGSIYKKSH